MAASPPAAVTLPAPLAPASDPTYPSALVPVVPVLLTPALEIARMIRQNEGADLTAGVVWIVSSNEVNHIDVQAGRPVQVAPGAEGELWSTPWFQRLLVTLGGALAAASAFRLFFA